TITSPSGTSGTGTGTSVIGTTLLSVSTVNVYKDAACTSAVTSGSRTLFTGAGLAATVNTVVTTFYATETDGSGTSPCSTSFGTYNHLASVGSTSPSSGTTTTPAVFGSAMAGSTVTLFKDAACATTSVGSGTAAAFTSGITVSTGVSTVLTTYYA